MRKKPQQESRGCNPDHGQKYEVAFAEESKHKNFQNLIVWVQLPEIEQSQLAIKLTGNLLTIKKAQARQLDLNALERSEIVGNSQQLKSCLKQVAAAAGSDSAVLICGETGTGKELFARAVHQNSCRDGENFVAVDCRSIPESIAEKLLLGQSNGSGKGHPGLLPQANRGTLFLDEVGDLSLATQKIIFQLLVEGSYCPVGTSNKKTVDFRIIAATNNSLSQLVEQGTFSDKLLSLFQPQTIEVPPLRHRVGDIDLLADFFIQHFCRSEGLSRKNLAPEFLDVLKKYPWPGNVRELKNSLGQALLRAKNQKTLFPQDLPAHIRVQVKKSLLGQKQKTENERRKEFLPKSLRFAEQFI